MLEESSSSYLGATAQEFDAGKSIMDELDMVAEKDRDVFTESTKPSHLSQFFQKGEKRFCLNYSRRVGSEYRSVMLEVIPARNFTSAYQSVYLYVKEG